MGRKIVWQVFLLVAVLAALYGQQEIFAQEDAQAICEEEEKEPEDGEEQGEEQEKEPPLPYEVSYEEADGEEQYYTVKPQVTISHPGETGETVYTVENEAGTVLEGRISQPGGQAVIGQETFAEGENRLRIWIEYTPPGQEKELQIFYEKELLFKVDTAPPALDMWVDGGNIWNQYQAGLVYQASENTEGSGIKYIVCYVNGKEQERSEKEKGSFVIRQTSKGGQGIPVAAAAFDRAGNRTVWEGEVYVDASPPSVQISGAKDYLITSKDIHALCAASDDNMLDFCSVQTIWTSPEGEETVLDGGEWSGEGGSRQAEQIFQNDGIYRIHVRAADAAGFHAETKVQVIVDKNNPVITYVDELDGTWLKEFCWDRPVSELITDFTSYTYRLTLDGVPYLPGQTIRKEGRHLLEAEAVDAAGNRSRAAAEFAIDRTPPQILFEDVENGRAYEERRTCTVRLGNSGDWIREIRVNGKKIELDPDTDVYTCTFDEYRVYKMEVAAADKAGNKAERSVLFEIVAKESLADKLLSPVRQSLGLEEEQFKREKETEEKESAQDSWDETALPAVVAAGLLLLPGFVCFRRIVKKKRV